MDYLKYRCVVTIGFEIRITPREEKRIVSASRDPPMECGVFGKCVVWCVVCVVWCVVGVLRDVWCMVCGVCGVCPTSEKLCTKWRHNCPHFYKNDARSVPKYDKSERRLGGDLEASWVEKTERTEVPNVILLRKTGF